MDRVYQAPTPGGAFAKMRADAATLSAEYRVGWTSRDTVCPAPTGILWLLVATGLAAIAVAALPPALGAAAVALVLGVRRIRECNLTVTYFPHDGLAWSTREPGG